MEVGLQTSRAGMQEMTEVTAPNRGDAAVGGRRGANRGRADMGLLPRAQRSTGVAYDPVTHEGAARTHDVAEEVDAGRQRTKLDVRLERQAQPIRKESLNFATPDVELCAALVHEHEVVDVTNVSADLERVFDERVQLVHVYVGKKLT